MFLGHFAVGLALKRAAPRASLGTLTLAALWLDALWPLFLLLGIERTSIAPRHPNPFLALDFVSYPLSHSLLLTLVWGILFAIVYAARTRYRVGAVVVGVLVLSHWVLDFLVHRPDLPLWPGGPTVGLGLWFDPIATIIVESLMFLLGLVLYVRRTRPRNLIGKASLWAYVIVLAALYVADANAPAPHDMTVVAYIGVIGWIFVPWAFWIDHNRELR